MTKFREERLLCGRGKFSGPVPGGQFKRVVKLIQDCLPAFGAHILQKRSAQERIDNEDGLNRCLSRFISNTANSQGIPFFAEPESMEDETSGSSPAVDIGIYLYVADSAIDPPKITVFEGKRLSNSLHRKRRREYVYGHQQAEKHIACGGLERFKKTIHGRDFNQAGMIGYMQDDAPQIWYKRINKWISELVAKDHDPKWQPQEQLTSFKLNGRVATSSSTVYRKDENIRLTHLWIDLTDD
jgi:hypothetical protein